MNVVEVFMLETFYWFVIYAFGFAIAWAVAAFGFWLFCCGLKRIRKDLPAEKQ